MADPVSVVMLHVSGQDDETQWFDFHMAFFDPGYRVEWPKGTMLADDLPFETADWLIRHGHARAATETERAPKQAPEPSRHRMGDIRDSVSQDDPDPPSGRRRRRES